MKINQIKVLALLLASGGLTLSSCKGNSGQQQGMQAPELTVMTVASTDATLETAYPATLEGQNDVEIRPQISGFITKVHVDDGDIVKKGQVLFTIDQVQLQAAVEQAQASVAVAQANVNTATTNANNNKILRQEYHQRIGLSDFGRRAHLRQGSAFTGSGGPHLGKEKSFIFCCDRSRIWSCRHYRL